MSTRIRNPWPLVAAVLALAGGGAVVALGASAGPAAASGTSLNQLNNQLSSIQAHEQSLSGSIAGLHHMIASLDGQISLVEQREAAVRVQLNADKTRLLAARAALGREQSLLARLRAQLAHARMILAAQLVSNYEGSKPNIVTVVLNSNGFTQLLDQLNFLKRAEQQQQALITVTKAAKARADAAAVKLGHLTQADTKATDATATQASALAGMNALLDSRQSALSKAQGAQEAALAASRAHGAALRSQISKVEAEQAAAAAAANQVSDTAFSGGGLGANAGWAIPYAIVLCESGGQNLPPNSAGASGYYQIMPATWKLFGGSGPAAYLTSKSEQDAVAARIWNGGAGASNWVCAGIVGIH
jgi:septal ring factor EnvC (AmiA/AmiB activator)